jgi:hypothetical protein
MSKFSKLDKKSKKIIIYASIAGVLLIAFLVVRLVILVQERSRTFIFSADPTSTSGYQLSYQYGLLDQEDYESLSIDISYLENLTFDEIGNPSPRQENSKISKEYGNLQLDLIYPIGSIYQFDGSSVSITDQYIGDTKKYTLTWVDTQSHSQTFNAYHELVAYLEPYLVQEDQKLSTLSIISDADQSNTSSLRIFSNGFGLTQYGFPSGCEMAFSHLNPPDDSSDPTTQAFNLQEECPPNQAAFYPGLLDSIGFMDKIDFFITTDGYSGAFPIIIDPNDAFAIVTGNHLIQSDEINSFLFIINSASRIHLTAHNNFVRIGTNWSASSSLPESRLSFPHADLELMNLPGELLFGKDVQAIDADSDLQIIDGERIRTSLNATLFDQNESAYLSRLYMKGLFSEIILNDRTIIKINDEK